MTILSSGDGRTVCPPAVSRRDNPQTSFEAEEAINKGGSRVTHLSVVLGVIESQPGLTTGEVGDESGRRFRGHRIATGANYGRGRGRVRTGSDGNTQTHQ